MWSGIMRNMRERKVPLTVSGTLSECSFLLYMGKNTSGRSENKYKDSEAEVLVCMKISKGARRSGATVRPQESSKRWGQTTQGHASHFNDFGEFIIHNDKVK